MNRKLLLGLIAVAAAEVMVLTAVGRLVGIWETFGLIFLTSLLGAYLAQREGRRVWEYARYRLANGEVPTDSILDGICIFAGGLLLILPGFITDVLGLFLLLPLTRPVAKLLILKWIRRLIGNGDIRFYYRR